MNEVHCKPVDEHGWHHPSRSSSGNLDTWKDSFQAKQSIYVSWLNVWALLGQIYTILSNGWRQRGDSSGDVAVFVTSAHHSPPMQ